MYSSALDLKGTIVWNQLCSGLRADCVIRRHTNDTSDFKIDLPDARTLGQAKAILDDGSNYYGSINRDGSFVMYVARTLRHCLRY